MSFDNNFGAAHPPPAWELSPHDLSTLASYVRDTRDESYDDLFDDGLYQSSGVYFRGHAHPMKPRGQTFYRPAVEYAAQGMPKGADKSHGDYVYPSVRFGAAPGANGPVPTHGYRYRDPVQRYFADM